MNGGGVRPALFLLIATLTATGCGTTESSPTAPARQVPVEITVSARQDIDITVDAVGTLRADRAVEIRPKRAGHIQALPLVEGATVAAGDVLARLDDTDLRAQVDVGLASVRDAEVREASARRQLARMQPLLSGGIVAQEQYDDVHAELERASANLEVAKATLALARARLAETVIVAPFDGVVGQRRVDVGAYVREGDTLATLVDLDPLEIEFTVSDRFLAQLRRDRAVSVGVTSHPDERFVGTVVFVAPEVDEVNRTVTVKARLPNPAGELRPGQFASVTLTLDRHVDAVVIPEEALLSDGQRSLVFVVEDDVARARQVTTGARELGRVEITDGLAAGQRIVQTGHEKLDPGADNPVREVEAEAEAGA